MQNRIVEINSDGAYISVKRGFLSVRLKDEKAGQVPIDDMAALVIRGHGASFSANICARLAEANIPVVICGSNQSPASVVWPVSGHFAQGLRMQAQATAKKPMLKRLWMHIIKAKIIAQADVLQSFSKDADDLLSMAGRVKSGDSDNLEAQAARRYWPRLMGDEFRRDRNADGINAVLNYGYTVLRAATARSILTAGLHPSLSVNHQSRGDALRLADDLMEPFRPWVDQRVCGILSSSPDGTIDLTSGIKAALASVLTIDFETPQGTSPMQVCIDRAAQSLARVFMGEQRDIELPRPPVPLMLVPGNAA
jgi:CRISP-associated protein Cas1